MATPDTPPDEGRGDRARRGPELVSIIARHNRAVEFGIAVVTLAVYAFAGILGVTGLWLADANGVRLPGLVRWVPSAALLASLLIGGLGLRHGRRHGRPMMPWVLLGGVVWIIPTVWALARMP